MATHLGVLTLPGDLNWVDEFAWSPVARAAEYSLTGALIIEEAVKQAGRPLTLTAANEELGYVWLNRATVRALYSLAATPNWSGTLILHDGRSFTVAFREVGVTAQPVLHAAPQGDEAPYTLTLTLQTV